MSDDIRARAEGARAAALQLSHASEGERNAALEAIAGSLGPVRVPFWRRTDGIWRLLPSCWPRAG